MLHDATVAPAVIDGVNCEWISRGTTVQGRVLLYLHGGGWILGWGGTHRRMVAELAGACAARALAVDYRLAPEFPFPAPLDDCLTVYRQVLQQGVSPGEIVIAGDSAGGNLTMACLLALRDAGEPLPALGVGISPALDLSGGELSASARRDRVVSPKAGRFMARSYLGGQDPRNPLISPVYGDLRGLPPMLIQAGCEEGLRAGAECFAERAQAAGVDVTLEIWPGMWHVWHCMPGLPEAGQALQRIGGYVRGRLSSNCGK
jgi:epsilon-lactone hydrolase